MRKPQRSLQEQLSDAYFTLFGVKKDYVKNNDQKTKSNHDKTEADNDAPALKDPSIFLRNGYSLRKVCNISMAVLPDDYILDPKRLDAPCEMCINRYCPYSMHMIWGV